MKFIDGIHCFFTQDEDKNSALKLSIWRKILRYIRRLNSYHELIADGEATFSTANANGNPEEQSVKSQFIQIRGLKFGNFILFSSSNFRFIVKDRCTSYSSSQRSLMVMQVLLRTKYDDSEKVSANKYFVENRIDKKKKKNPPFIFSVESDDY